MAILLAYPVDSDGTDVRFRVIRRARGRAVPLPGPLCAGLCAARGQPCRRAPGGAVVTTAEGLRALRRWFVGSRGDRVAIYGADGKPYQTVCDAVRTVLGWVPGGERCGSR